MASGDYQALRAALEWHLDAGADAALDESSAGLIRAVDDLVAALGVPAAETQSVKSEPAVTPDSPPLGLAEARGEAVARAAAAGTLTALREAIAAFDGIGLKGTATNLVFAAGCAAAPVMLVGDVPGADDDRSGQAMTGPHGQFLDLVLKAAGLGRDHDIYMVPVLNWRPPGGRSPLPAEIETGLPFVERHIQLVRPRLLLLCGATAAKALLGRQDSLSKLRGGWHDYTPRTLPAENAPPIPALPILDPAYVLQNPAQKRLLWADMLSLLEKRRALGLVN